MCRTAELSRFGLAPPQTVALVQEVNRIAGVLMPSDTLTVQECADRLQTYLLEGGVRA